MTLDPLRSDKPVPASPNQLSNIQILRAIAALMVLVYHIGNEFGDRGFSGSLPGFGAGSAGVDIFFVVSGFIMVYSTADAFGSPNAPSLFLARRVVRLVPLYWIVTTIFVMLMARQSRHTGLPGETWRWIAASYAFLFYPHGDGGDFPLYAQGWTLNFEMFFYICFAVTLPLKRAIALSTLAIAFVALTTFGLVSDLPWPIDRWANTNIIEFVLGLGLAEVYARGFQISLPVAVAMAAAGFAIFALTIGSVDAWLPYRGFVWGPPALAVVAAAALYRPRRSSFARTALERLGDASYALYLVHYAFFMLLGDMVGRLVLVTVIPPAFYGGLCFFGAIVLAFIVHFYVEQPITRGLNRTFGLSERWHRLTDGRKQASARRVRII